MNNLRTAVIGVGNMGKNHARIYSEISNLVGVADLDEKLGKEVAEKNNTKYYKDYNEMLEKEEVDAVSVVVPTHLHKKVTNSILERGISVLLEKPISDNLEDGQAILDIQKKSGAFLLIGHVERFNPAVTKLKTLIDEGRLGDVIDLIAIRVGIMPPKTPNSDVALDLGIHDIDVFNYILNESPKSKEISKQKLYKNSVADSATITLQYNRASGVIKTNWITPTKMRRLYVTGTEGFVELDYIKQEVVLYEKMIVKKKIGDYYDFISVSDAPKKQVFVSKKEPLKEELQFFLENLENLSASNAEAAYKALEVLS